MRLDKYLKVSRIIKRRTVANEACDAGRVLVNGKVARASYDVKAGDVLELQLGDDEVYAAVIAPEIELTITPLANVRSYLPCFDEADDGIGLSLIDI